MSDLSTSAIDLIDSSSIKPSIYDVDITLSESNYEQVSNIGGEDFNNSNEINQENYFSKINNAHESNSIVTITS